MRDLRLVKENNQRREYVNSYEDFKVYTIFHIKRVQVLAMELKRAFPAYFDKVSMAQVENVFLYHDQAKVLENLTSKDGRVLSKAIYDDAYAKVPPQNFRSNVVDVLNAHDQEIMEYAMEKFLVSSKEAREQIKTLEMIADFVDRGCHAPTEEEFGRKMDLASNFLVNVIKADSEVVFMAKALEAKYAEVTAGMEYQPQITETEIELAA